MIDDNPQSQKKSLVFTDLDGTLLDHHSYSFDAAKAMLDHLKQHSIPLIIVSSKTRPEIIQLQQAIGINDPFVVENGAGIFIPPNSSLKLNHSENWCTIKLGKSYEEVRAFVTDQQKKFPIRGFADMDVDEVVRLTGLERERAALAMQRDFTEPFVIDDETAIDEITQAANAVGLDIVKGGRFYHVITFHQDKANALKQLVHLYSQQYHQHPDTIALGDSENDFTMLKAADQPILIPKASGEYAALRLENLMKAHHPGPKGWNEAMENLMLRSAVV